MFLAKKDLPFSVILYIIRLEEQMFWKYFIKIFQIGVKFFVTYADTYNERVNLIAKYT